MAGVSDNFIKGIEILDFSIGDTDAGNVLLVSGQFSAAISPVELFALEQAGYYKADAVYFRRFEDGRPPIPQIFIYDCTANKIDAGEYAEIHRNLWSSCIVPVFIVIERSKIKIFDCRKPVDIFMGTITTTPIDTLDFTSDAIKKYSAKLFDNGSFWETAAGNNNFLEEKTAYYKLIEGLKKIRNIFLIKSGLPPSTAHKLLVQSILIKYLEERGDEGGMLFAKQFFLSFGATNFCGVLRIRGQIVPLFEKLGEHFNGKIFEWNDPQEKELIRNKDLSQLADFLDGDNENNQYVLWRLYSFRHLPVELISSVYEEFLGKEKKDVVYTPNYLVNFLVDECMPVNSPRKSFKLIDVSCGSGIFLVVAFKRLVTWWRYDKYVETGKLLKPNSNQLLKILKENIHGVDLSDDSTKLTIFSLALALCDMLTPKEIWTELQFDDLTESNIFSQDFFRFLTKTNTIKYDLVIGNPPFNPPKKISNQDYFNEVAAQYDLNIIQEIPDYNVALMFLDQAMKLLKPEAKLCLILKSAPLLYNDTLYFRQYFFCKYNVLQIADFTSLKGILFGKASVETAALFVENSKPDDKDILHLTVRNTRPVEQKLFFEIDHYDFHYVTKEEAVTSPTIWKSNLLGGGRLNFLINRLGSLQTLKTFLKNKKKNDGWLVGEGFIRGKITDPPAAYLTGKPSVTADNFTADKCKITVLKEQNFERPRPEELYKGPLLLLKENIESGKIPIALLKSDVSFDSRIVGISAPRNSLYDLQKIYDFFIKHNNTFCFYIFSTTSQFFLGTTTAIQKKDLMHLPYPVQEKDMALSYAEKIIRDDVLNFRFEQLYVGHRAKINGIAKKKELDSFGDVFCKAINSIYQEGNKRYQLSKIIVSETFYSCEFLSTTKNIEEPKYDDSRRAEKSISELVENITGSNVRITRVLKMYAQDKIFLIKPKQIRYWLKSIALRDADETFDEILDPRQS